MSVSQFNLANGLVVSVQFPAPASPPPPSGSYDIVDGNALTGTNDSPTGRNPRLMWSADQQSNWNRYKADYEANPTTPATVGGKWYKQVKTHAETLPRSPNTDIGLFNAQMYQFTGDAQYVTGALECFDNWLYTLPGPPDWNTPYSWDSNTIRNHWGNLVIALEYLWPGLTGAQQDELYVVIIQNLEKHVDFYVSDDGWVLGDSDQVLGVYFHLMMLAALFPTEPRVQALATASKVGGLIATASNRTTTARNAIRYYHEALAPGGDWCESSHYNNDTPVFSLTGWIALKNFHGVDYFPEIADYWPRLAKAFVSQLTPDLELNHKWGDEQEPDVLLVYLYAGPLALLTGVLRGTTTAAEIHQLLLDMGAKHGFTGGTGAFGPVLQQPQALYWYDDQDATASYETDYHRSHYSSGLGAQRLRSGWADADTLYCNLGARRVTDAQYGTWWPDHLVRFHGSLWAWRDGGFVLRGPMSYNGASVYGEAANVALVYAMGEAWEFKDVVCEHHATTHAFLQTASGGSFLDADYGVTYPPSVVHEMTRAALYVPGTTNVIIVQDRLYVADVDPTDLSTLWPGGASPDYTNSRIGDFYARAHAKSVQLWHMPAAPTVGSTGATWDADNADKVRLSVLHPASPTFATINELTDYQQTTPHRFGWHTTNVFPVECKYQLQVRSNAVWTPFLSVFASHGTTTPTAATLVEDAGKAHGAHVTRTGESDVVAIFNSAQASAINTVAYTAANQTQIPRQHYHAAKSFTISWTASAATTELYLADLDPALHWTLALDGGSATGITPTADGFFRRTVSGTGAHSIAVVGANTLASTARTTAQAGTWWDPATWTGGVVPRHVDTVTVDHAVTVNWNATCAGLTRNAAFSVDRDVRFTLTGNATGGNVTWTMDKGSHLRFDCTAADRKALFGTAWNQTSSKFLANGTLDAPVTIDKTGSNACWVDSGDEGGGTVVFGNSFGCELRYVRMTGVGKADGSVGVRSNNNGGTDMVIDHCVFDGCATIFADSIPWSALNGNDYSVRDSFWRNSITGSINLDAFSDGNTGAGTREVVGNVFDKQINLGLNGMAVNDNYFDVMPYMNGTVHSAWNRNVVRFTANTQTLQWEHSTDRTYLVVDHTAGNPHFIQSAADDKVHTRIVADNQFNNPSDGGDGIFGSGIRDCTIEYFISLKSETNGWTATNITNPVEQPTPQADGNRMTIKHATVVGKYPHAVTIEYNTGNYTRILVLQDVILAAPAGSTGAEKAAMMWDQNYATYGYDATMDPAGISNIWMENAYAGANYTGIEGDLTAPPAGPIYASDNATGTYLFNPVDPTRSFANWSVSRYDAAAGATLRVRTDATRTVLKLNPYLGMTMFDWVWAGYAPQNAALLGTGTGGSDIGAVQV